jgi:hypothetical protein
MGSSVVASHSRGHCEQRMATCCLQNKAAMDTHQRAIMPWCARRTERGIQYDKIAQSPHCDRLLRSHSRSESRSDRTAPVASQQIRCAGLVLLQKRRVRRRPSPLFPCQTAPSSAVTSKSMVSSGDSFRTLSLQFPGYHGSLPDAHSLPIVLATNNPLPNTHEQRVGVTLFK